MSEQFDFSSLLLLPYNYLKTGSFLYFRIFKLGCFSNGAGGCDPQTPVMRRRWRGVHSIPEVIFFFD
jgi:hypothetical protein